VTDAVADSGADAGADAGADLGRRIAIVGTSGSGKTTVARRLAALDLPHIELDALFWRPDWRQAHLDQFRSSVSAATGGDAWICDGNYSRARDIILPRAETVVWLDLPLRTCLWRVVRRTVRRTSRREVLWGTNREQWSRLVGGDSLIWWVLRTHRRRRREWEVLIAGPETRHLRVARLRSAGEIEAWLVMQSA
jgi:adenylate kinase family enzyme